MNIFFVCCNVVTKYFLLLILITSFEHQQLQEYMLGAEFRLPSVAYEDATPNKKTPIRVKFEIPYFTVSGIQVMRFYTTRFGTSR